MPEGPLVHHYARRHARDLPGVVRASSPQGKFPEATDLDGTALEGVEAYGKHLFYRFAPNARRVEPAVVHVHLGQAGLFLHHDVPPPEARPQVRLRLESPVLAVDLIAPVRCELLDLDGRDRVVARLGPDPLRDDADPEAAWARFQASRAAVGALLLDQSVIAGVGNVLRAEVLNIARISPERPAAHFSRDEFDRLWTLVVSVMERAAASGRIVTVPGTEGAPDEQDRRYVYRRPTCRRCGSAVAEFRLGGRQIYACPSCQSR